MTTRHRDGSEDSAHSGHRRYMIGLHSALPTRASTGRESHGQYAHWQVGDRVSYHSGERAFQVEQILVGGMGVVYVVLDTQTGDPFVVKGIREQLVRHAPLRKRFQREAEAWIALKKHPNIVQARGFEYLDDQPHIFLEFVAGGSLRSALRRNEFTLADLLGMAVEICRGMRHAANMGLIAHRDLKPDNIMLTSGQNAKVTDFGLVKLLTEADPDLEYEELDDGQPFVFSHNEVFVGTRITGSNVPGFGTKEYMSPEQWHDPGSVDIRSDIYSFGVMLYEMLTHVHPFYGKSRQEVYRKHLGYTPRPPSAIRPDIPVSVDRVVARCLEKEREARYPNFTELQFELMHILQREFREIVPPILSRERATADEMNERGAALFRLGRLPQALTCFDEVLKDSPENAVAWANRGVILAEFGELDSALQCLDVALQHEPNAAIVLANRGLTLAELGRDAEALACFEKAIQLERYLQVAWRHQSEVLNRLGRHEQAYYSALKATHLEPRDAAAFFQQAYALTHLERTTQALDALARHEELAGESSSTLHLRARIAFTGKRYVECLRFCGQIGPDDPEYADAMTLEFRAGLESDAFDSIDAVLTCMPGAAFSRTALALIKKRLSQGGQNNPRLLALAAEVAVRAADFVAARAFYQRWSGVVQRLGLVDARSPRLSSAEVARKATTSSRQRIAQGALLLALKEYRLAVQALREGVARAPRSADGWRLLGDANVQLGQFADALEAYQHLTQLRPDDARQWLNVAEAALRCGDYPLAQEAVEHCRRMRESALVIFLRGAALFGQRKFHEACRHFERTLALDATFGAAWWNLALCQRQLGRHQEVTRALEEARRLDARFWYRSAYVDQPVLPNPLRTEKFNLP